MQLDDAKLFAAALAALRRAEAAAAANAEALRQAGDDFRQARAELLRSHARETAARQALEELAELALRMVTSVEQLAAIEAITDRAIGEPPSARRPH